MTEQGRRRKVDDGGASEIATEGGKLFDAADAATARSRRLEAGSMIVVTWGEELHAPIQFNSFRIGGLTLQIPIREGETARDAYARAWVQLEALGEEQFEEKLKGFMQRARRASDAVRSR
jgi:hypothetical protein